MQYCSKCTKYYDGELYAVCPYCFGGDLKNDNGGNSMPSTIGKNDADDKISISDMFRRKRSGNMNATVIRVKQKLGFDPVVGWLVCVEGNDIGKDFRLHSGNNTVGRSDEMNVCLQGDPSVSRYHFSVTYDHLGNRYFINSNSESRELVYVNDYPVVAGAVKLKRGDKIRVANTVLIFVPFDSEDFQWEWNRQ